jgi:hypothetical protein
VSFTVGSVGGLWLALVGGFPIVAAGAEAQHSALEAIVSGLSRHLYSAFPVVDRSALLPEPLSRRAA